MRRLIGLRFQEEGEVEMGDEVYYSRTTCDMHRLYMHVDLIRMPAILQGYTGNLSKHVPKEHF